MPTIALLEKKESLSAISFDKIISFERNNHTNIDEYIEASDFYRLYDEVFERLHLWLNRVGPKNFVYGKINILDAYGKQIFDFLFNLCQKQYVVKKIIEKESPETLFISDELLRKDLRYAFLNFFILDFLPTNIALKYFEKNNPPQILQPKKHVKRNGSLSPVFSFLRALAGLFNTGKKENILIYSDFSKISGLFEHFKSKNIIFLREKLPLRLFFPLLCKRVKFCLFSDFSLSAAAKESITIHAEEFINELQKSDEPLLIGAVDFASYVKKYLTELWRSELIDTLGKLEQMFTLFRKFKITSVLVDEDRSVYKNLLVQASKHFQARSYVNCHGEPFHKIGTLPLAADYIFLWSNRQKKLLSEWGLDEKKIFVVGCSKYDAYLKTPASLLKNKICKDLKLSSSSPICLIATRPIKEGRNILENLTWKKIKEIITAASSFKNINIIIKLHPGDDNEPYIKDFVKSLKQENITILRNYDSLLLAKGVDFLIVYASTFALDGLAYKKPVILADERSIERYRDLNVFYDGSSIQKLRYSINGILEATSKEHINNWEKAAGFLLNGLDGKASQGIAGFLAQ